MTAAESLGRGWEHAVHPDDLQPMLAQWQRIIRGETKVFEIEMRFRRHDGVYRWHLSRALLLEATKSYEPKWLGVATDIHDRKVAEEILCQREAHLRLIMDSIPALIAYVGADRRYISVNKTYEQWFNKEKSNILGQTIESFHGSRVANLLEPFIKKALAGDTVEFELSIPKGYSGIRYIHGTYVPDKASNGHVVGFFVFVRDESEAKIAEETIRQSYQRFINVARATKDIVWDWQMESNTRWWSDAISSVLGYDADAVGHDQAWWIGHIHEDDRERVSANLQNLLASGQQSWSEQYRFRRADGTFAHVHDRGYILFETDTGNPVQMVGALQDISDRKLTEEALLKAKESAEAASQTKSNFLANMSHEIRTPLGVVLGFSELLANPDLTQDDRDNCVATIKRNGELLSCIINDILDISKIEAGRLETERLKINLPSILRELNSAFQLQAREKGISFTLQFDGKIP